MSNLFTPLKVNLLEQSAGTVPEVWKGGADLTKHEFSSNFSPESLSERRGELVLQFTDASKQIESRWTVDQNGMERIRQLELWSRSQALELPEKRGKSLQVEGLLNQILKRQELHSVISAVRDYGAIVKGSSGETDEVLKRLANGLSDYMNQLQVKVNMLPDGDEVVRRLLRSPAPQRVSLGLHLLLPGFLVGAVIDDLVRVWSEVRLPARTRNLARALLPAEVRRTIDEAGPSGSTVPPALRTPWADAKP